uniref:Uncharacterized protein n=1 Tax=Anguilla anguilla TaxID=7936 RepID=A0A0E9PJW8_ANGAN
MVMVPAPFQESERATGKGGVKS